MNKRSFLDYAQGTMLVLALCTLAWLAVAGVVQLYLLIDFLVDALRAPRS